jgi:glutamate decarboxylase
VSRALRERGWQVPAYTFPADRTDLSVLRIVCRNGFSHDLAEQLLGDLRSAVDQLEAAKHAEIISGPTGFRH